jgi:hypothetical protein
MKAKNVSAVFGRVGVKLIVSGETNVFWIRFYYYSNKEFDVLNPNAVNNFNPEELRWMADSLEHFERWRQGEEDWPLLSDNRKEV